jgi:16S rRNA (cytidine1402-2'-O)-methyltransferase
VSEARGKLLVVPCGLDFGCDRLVPVTSVMPEATLQLTAATSHWICENAKSARAWLKRVGEVHPLAVPIQQQHIAELPREVHKKGDHSGTFDARPLLAAALGGADIGLLSEAGMPAIADPGSSVVRAAHDLGLQVVPLVGPVSLLLALAASGLNGQSFAFVGYLPQDAAARTQRIRELETQALRAGQAQLFIETPYRNVALWDALVKTLQPSTRVAVASGLTLDRQMIASRPVSAWRGQDAPLTNDTPAVFLVGR